MLLLLLLLILLRLNNSNTLAVCLVVQNCVRCLCSVYVLALVQDWIKATLVVEGQKKFVFHIKSISRHVDFNIDLNILMLMISLIVECRFEHQHQTFVLCARSCSLQSPSWLVSALAPHTRLCLHASPSLVVRILCGIL